MKIRYEIEKDKALNKYILWEVHRNYMVERCRGFKYQCLNKKKSLKMPYEVIFRPFKKHLEESRGIIWKIY